MTNLVKELWFWIPGCEQLRVGWDGGGGGGVLSHCHYPISTSLSNLTSFITYLYSNISLQRKKN